jgi:hypothetical protein
VTERMAERRLAKRTLTAIVRPASRFSAGPRRGPPDSPARSATGPVWPAGVAGHIAPQPRRLPGGIHAAGPFGLPYEQGPSPFTTRADDTPRLATSRYASTNGRPRCLDASQGLACYEH